MTQPTHTPEGGHPNPEGIPSSLQERLKAAALQGFEDLRTHHREIRQTFEEVLGPLPERSLSSILSRFAAQRRMEEVTLQLLGEGRMDLLTELVRIEGSEHLLALRSRGQGAIILFAHHGPTLMLGTAITRIGLPIILLRNQQGKAITLPGVEDWNLQEGDALKAALFLKRAVAALSQGISVVMALDGVLGTSGKVLPCLGRMMRFPEGPMALQRLSGAPLIFTKATWTAFSEISIQFEAPLVPSEPDEAILADWLDRHFREHPSHFQVNKLNRLLSAPRVPPTVHRIAVSGC